MENKFDEAVLKQQLSSLVFWKQLVFLIAVCQRLIPSFSMFSKETGFSGEDILRGLLLKAWNNLFEGVTKVDFSAETYQAESLAPETENFDSIYTSSALDAAVSISLLMKSFCDNDTGTIVEAVTLICDSVDMYAQELENMNPNDSDLEEKILNHPLMQQELERQCEDLEFIETLNDDISMSMNAVKTRWYGRADSCLSMSS